MTTVASFQIEHQQYINALGEVVNDLPEFANDQALLTDLYKLMVQVRTFDTKAIALQRTGKLGTYASILGQEAVFVGLGNATTKDDVYCPAYRDYGAMLQRGVQMRDILNYWGGDERGSNFQGDAKEDFPICVPIATQCLHAAGVATAMKIRKQQRAAIVTCGDGATSKGDFLEALNVAGTWQLPVLFVVNNNQYAISIKRQNQTGAQTIAQKAIGAGMPGVQVDGNDIIAMKDAAEKALTSIRAGNGPQLIEAISYRLCDHTTADDASRYRSDEEMTQAWKEEPILRMKNYLTSAGFWSEEQEQTLLQQSAELVEQEVQAYLSTGKQTPESMFDYLYQDLPDIYHEQRDMAIAEGEK